MIGYTFLTMEDYGMNEKEIRVLLLSIGFIPSYKGFPYLVNVLLLAINKENCLFLNELYYQTAEHFCVTDQVVHQDIYSLLRVFKNSGHIKKLEELIGYKIYETLTIKEFVYIIVDYLEK